MKKFKIKNVHNGLEFMPVGESLEAIYGTNPDGSLKAPVEWGTGYEVQVEEIKKPGFFARIFKGYVG